MKIRMMARPVQYPHGMRGLFAWMRVNAPRLYTRAMPKVRSAALSGIGSAEDFTDVSSAPNTTAPVAATTADKIRDILLGVSQAYLTSEQMKMQKKVIDIQVARAQQGLPPLDIDLSRYGVGPQAQVGIDSNTQKFLLWGLAGLGAIYLIPKLLKR